MIKLFNILKYKTLLTLLLIITVAIGVFLVLKVTHYGENQARRFFLSQAELVAAAVDPSDVASFSGTDSELKTAAYKRTLQRLTRIKQTMPDVRFVYLMRLQDQQVHFIFDTENIHSKDYSPPGEVYDNPSPALKDIFVHGKSFEEGPFTDSWGNWVSAHAPIYDPHSGKVIAISGIDINAQTWQRHIQIYQLSCALISGLLICLLIGSVFLHNAVKHWQDAEGEVNKMARYDALTGLPNRYLINEIMRRVIEDSVRHELKFALLFLDMNNFKWVNDTLGHSTGDLLLQEIAGRLKHVLRETDTVGRFGGDEFIFILEDLVDEVYNARMIAEKILAVIAEPLHIKGLDKFTTTASIGIAIYPKDGETVEKLMSNADRAMYQAKKNPLSHIIFINQI